MISKLVFKAVLRRALLERFRMHRDSRMFNGRRIISIDPISKEEAQNFRKLMRGEWDGTNEDLPHCVGCEALEYYNPGECTCGIKQLAQNHLFEALLIRLRWQAATLWGIFRLLWHPEDDVYQLIEPLCEAKRRCRALRKSLRIALQPLKVPPMWIRRAGAVLQTSVPSRGIAAKVAQKSRDEPNQPNS